MQLIYSTPFSEMEPCSNLTVTCGTGLIDNLPEGAVEVPVLASRRGLDPIHVGPLPDHLAV